MILPEPMCFSKVCTWKKGKLVTRPSLFQVVSHINFRSQDFTAEFLIEILNLTNPKHDRPGTLLMEIHLQDFVNEFLHAGLEFQVCLGVLTHAWITLDQSILLFSTLQPYNTIYKTPDGHPFKNAWLSIWWWTTSLIWKHGCFTIFIHLKLVV